MKNLLKWAAFLLVATLLFQSCDEEDPVEPDPLPDPTGQWVLTAATLVDGNVSTPETADPLVVQNAAGPGMALEVPVGDSQLTLGLITNFLLGAACETPTASSSYYLELTAETIDGNEVRTLYFGCVDGSSDVKEESGSWTVVENADGSYTITLVVSVAGTDLPIAFNNFVLNASSTQFSGTAVGYPMVADAASDIGPTNIQFLVADMTFTALQ